MDTAATPRIGGLEGKRAIVTGHRGGIGAAIARVLEASGCHVAGLDLPEVDLGALDGVAGHVGRAVAALGGLDIVVNNAGTTALGDLVDTPLAAALAASVTVPAEANGPSSAT